MPKLPGINHQRAVKTLQKAGFQIDRQDKGDEGRDADTMAAIVRDVGLTIEEFKRLL